MGGSFLLTATSFWLRLVFVTYGCLLGSLLLTVRSFFRYGLVFFTYGSPGLEEMGWVFFAYG